MKLFQKQLFVSYRIVSYCRSIAERDWPLKNSILCSLGSKPILANKSEAHIDSFYFVKNLKPQMQPVTPSKNWKAHFQRDATSCSCDMTCFCQLLLLLGGCPESFLFKSVCRLNINWLYIWHRSNCMFINPSLSISPRVYRNVLFICTDMSYKLGSYS